MEFHHLEKKTRANDKQEFIGGQIKVNDTVEAYSRAVVGTANSSLRRMMWNSLAA